MGYIPISNKLELRFQQFHPIALNSKCCIQQEYLVARGILSRLEKNTIKWILDETPFGVMDRWIAILYTEETTKTQRRYISGTSQIMIDLCHSTSGRIIWVTGSLSESVKGGGVSTSKCPNSQQTRWWEVICTTYYWVKLTFLTLVCKYDLSNSNLFATVLEYVSLTSNQCRNSQEILGDSWIVAAHNPDNY